MSTFSEQMALNIRMLDSRLAALEALEMGVSGGVTPAPTGQGSILISNATPAWTELVHPGAAYQHLETGAVTAGWSQTLNVGTAAGGGGEYLSLRDDVNGVTAAEFVNAHVGAAAAVQLRLKNEGGVGGDDALSVGTTGTGFTTAGIVLQDAGLIQAGVNLQALTMRTIGDKPIIFGVAGATEVLRLSSAEVLASLDLDFVSGKGVTHADGVTAGWVLRGDGTRYVPGALQVGDLPAHAAEHEVGGGDVVDHNNLFNYAGLEHINHLTITMTAGAGLTGGGTIENSRTFDVGAGDGITVNVNDVALTTPGTLTVSTGNSAVGNHTHAITSSANPGAAASLLASDVNGYLQLDALGIGVAPAASNNIAVADNFWMGLGAAAGRVEWDDQATDEINLLDCNVGINRSSPSARLDVLGRGLIEHSAFPALGVTRTTAATSTFNSGVRLTTETSGNALDGFGGGFVFAITDPGVTDSLLASIGAVRSGADNSGALHLNTYNAGSFQQGQVTILPAGNVGIGTTAPGSLMEWDFADEDLEFVDCHTASGVSSLEAVIEVQTTTGGVGYIPIYGSYS